MPTDTSGTGSGTGASTTPNFESSISDGTKSRLIISVPNYDGGTAVSYLRLGSAPTGGDGSPSDHEPGSDLANQVITDLTTNPSSPLNAFIDDTRDRDGGGGTADNSGQNAATNTIALRQAESLKLHTKGGWRDHSDGNRVSTTRGDKVEVIRGNYKLVVMGRQDSPSNGDVLDISGGHTVDANAAPGAISEIKWVQDKYSGTWKVTEETEKGDTKTVFHGDVEEIYYGNNVTSTIGSETPTAAIDLIADPASSAAPAGSTKSHQLNPTIVEKTWASSISSNTGSDGHRVPTMSEITYVDDDSSVKHCHKTTEFLRAEVEIAHKEVGFSAEGTACGLRIEGYIGPVILSYTGLKLEIDIGARIELKGGISLEIGVGPKYELNTDTMKIEAEGTELKAVQTTLATTNTDLTAATTKITEAETKIAALRTELDEAKTAIATNHTDISGGYDMIALVVSML